MNDPSNAIRLEDIAVLLHGDDDVAVAKREIPEGAMVVGGPAIIQTRETIPVGHKLALRPVSEGSPVRKYDQIIGFATQAIEPGTHVHVHNLAFAEFERSAEIGAGAKPTDYVPEDERATFQGIVRKDGRVATRNYLAVLTSVNCSATAAKYIAERFRSGLLQDFPNVDGVVALCHGTGCGMAEGSDGWTYLRRSLAGYARHPNVAGFLLLGLGCEINAAKDLFAEMGFEPGSLAQVMTIQEAGGTAATVQAGVERLQAMLPDANAVQREPMPASELILGMECGGSDAFSGITANPALGAAGDLLVRHGGTAILGETPEIYGAEHLLVRRAVSEEVGRKLLGQIAWWEDYTKKNGAVVDNNPAPGNKAGGLTTILEKSLGAAAKGGTSNLTAVYEYGEPVTEKGFVFMDTPGYDPVSVTGMVAGGANIVCFTTGRGSVFGCKPVPSLKLATNSPLYQRMTDDMDINCGLVLDGEVDIEEMGRRIFETILRTASGEQTKSEVLGFGDEEFVPWQVGAVL